MNSATPPSEKTAQTAARAPLGTLLMKARMRRDFEAVEDIGNRMLSANTSIDFVHRALARQFDELEQREKAVPHWQAVQKGNPRDFEASFHLADAHTRAGEPFDKAVTKAAPDASPAFRGHLRAALEEDRSRQTHDDDALKNVVICGVSYSGSTLIDRLLGGLPGTASIGESHWLTKAKGAQGYGPIDFDAETPTRLVPCTGCGPSCRTLTFPFRRQLAADHTNWFYRIARQLGTHNLVSADKNPPKIMDHDPLMRFDGLVVFKSLCQAWCSELEKRKAGESESYYLDECRKYVNVWTQNYRLFLEEFCPTGKVVFMSFEDFARDPADVLEAVCKVLSLEFDEKILSAIKPGHAIGGNARAIGRLRTAAYKPDITPLSMCDLPASHLQVLTENAEAARVLSLLRTGHQRTMNGQSWSAEDLA